jgi:hypothetical protein
MNILKKKKFFKNKRNYIFINGKLIFRNKIQKPLVFTSLPNNKFKDNLSSTKTNKSVNLLKHTKQTIENFK